MRVVLVTGAAGLIGSEAVRFFCDRGFTAIGIDNDMRKAFFGDEASTLWNRDLLVERYPDSYVHRDVDVRDRAAVGRIFGEYGTDIELVIHAAAQPSHDWAARDPFTDFDVNAFGTLVTLESCRRTCPDATFIFCSTNKVYGDTPNSLPLIEQKLRWDIEPDHPFHPGIDESMSVDDTTHSLFGVSKLAADVLVQEYGRYFGMRTAVFRGGCLTGPSHSGTKLHGFLSYLMRCAITGDSYRVLGYKGKQVRDNIHSYDLVNAFYHFHRAPRVAEVYNIGGSRFSCCSMLEAIALCEEIAGRRLSWSYDDTHRIGDHIWWISDIRKFQSHYPDWKLTRDVPAILREIHAENASRWTNPRH
jgi:CDP-paratose 2-epimerase